MKGSTVLWALWAGSPPWAGDRRSSTMDYLLGVVVLLGMAALPGRVALQNPKRNVPRLRLSYKGEFLVNLMCVY